MAPTYLAPIASTQIKTTTLIGWSLFGIGVTGVTILGALYLFQRAERNRYKNKNQNDKILIDITAFLSD